MSLTAIVRRLVRCTLGLWVALISVGTPAPGFPNRSLELVVPCVAGTAPDVVAHGLADGVSKHLGQQVVVVNEPGAGGAIRYKMRAITQARWLLHGAEFQLDLGLTLRHDAV